ncbi:LEAF RUST 10 DISEASE-RESISTANCE LOCUS RECEPTOR-LIKE PROTEIN KINASE-like 2.8 [Humulus lupulus]|uniref:LEAF RUST 10 DISEASE-RESISTANCE LOCUS RECEPTOR-LIKE PROTEIN KINASE-like 2.8 n=1 Tax=Humulus lupulus TaxID=3486 RepID=UPI002B416661|nr:LEAF RUST 10 DISEASE-RESISTANCE LOCUS RECEPTOR-LIKE PROTEIN KINASE-like 2.8 [Humulus lupulus]
MFSFKMATATIPLSFAIFFLITHSVLPSSTEAKGTLPKCPPVLCGKNGRTQLPFNRVMNPQCGVVKLNCSENGPRIQLKGGGHWFKIENISQSQPDSTISIDVKDALPADLQDRCKLMNEYSLPSPTDSYNFTAEISSTLYNCTKNLGSTTKDFVKTECIGYDFYYKPPNMSFPYEKQCPNTTLPFYSPFIPFTLQVKISSSCFGCDMRGGKCHNTTNNQFRCSLPPKKGHKRKMLKLGEGLAIIFGGIGILVIVLICCLRKFSILCWKKHNDAHQSIEAFLNTCGPLQVRRYSYSNIKKMTNLFTKKLGQGGFGSVYKGKLHDGHLVAVKMLNELKANDGEDFINEVAAISRTSHVNVVRLLGFCFEGAKKALIYEFMPNGSLEKFVYDENETEESYQLDWETYYGISLGIARGLEYLHRGCNTRILHFDIKPHNILLDADFVPKISDFGLAKVCTRKDSLLSMLGPRGTIGYIAPEVIYRNFGAVSHKSDVYSFGMMILELVGGRKNVNVRTEDINDIYFPQWIYKRLEVEELGLKTVMNEDDNVKARKMIITSLWCIQTDPSSRPTMSKVIEMLEGSLDSLQVPPKPFLSSPPRPPSSDSSTTFLSL